MTEIIVGGLIEYQPDGWSPDQVSGLATMATVWKEKECLQFPHLFDIKPIDADTVRYVLLALEGDK